MAFPEPLVTQLKSSLTAWLGADPALVVGRPLRNVDADGAVGVVAVDWLPGDFVIGQPMPAVATYLFSLQALRKFASEEEGITAHYGLAKNVLRMLYGDTTFRVLFGDLTETSAGYLERVQLWGVRQQRYLANEINGQFMFLSVTELWVQVENVPTP